MKCKLLQAVTQENKITVHLRMDEVKRAISHRTGPPQTNKKTYQIAKYYSGEKGKIKCCSDFLFSYIELSEDMQKYNALESFAIEVRI